MTQGVQTLFKYKNKDWTIDDLVKLSGVPERRLWQRLKVNNNVVTERILNPLHMRKQLPKPDFNSLIKGGLDDKANNCEHSKAF